MTDVLSYDPRTAQVVVRLAQTPPAELAQVVAMATTAAPLVAAAPPQERCGWLYAVADALEAHQDQIVLLADSETGLGTQRTATELARTAGQLRFYGDVAAEGSYLEATIDSRDGQPHLNRANHPLGPVAVFGASNFPLAFSVLGNDTGSALAAGCPVVAKAHDAHVGLSVLVADIAQEALRDAGAPEGTLGLVTGFEAGTALVTHDDIAAVGFTGSQAGGLALWRLANDRPVVIPVYAEMGTVNPIVVTPASVPDAESIAEGFVGSFTLGWGQYCTKPGLMFAPRAAAMPEKIAEHLARSAPEPVMLTERIAEALSVGVAELVEAGGEIVWSGGRDSAGWSGVAAVLKTGLERLRPGSRLLEECFGPVVLIVEYDDVSELPAVLEGLQGCLAAALFSPGPEDQDGPSLLAHLARTAGRVCCNEWTTGVAVSWAQHHGGPWPATSHPDTTSVGARGLGRWVRPVAYQAVPDPWLPHALRRDNPWNLPRRLDGKMVVATGQGVTAP